MSKIVKGLCWATGILLVALGNYFGLIADDAAQTMFIVLPVISVISLRSGGCLPRRKAA